MVSAENDGMVEFCKKRFQEMSRDPVSNSIIPERIPPSVGEVPTIVMRCTAIVAEVDVYATIATGMIRSAAINAKTPTVHRVKTLETLQQAYVLGSEPFNRSSDPFPEII